MVSARRFEDLQVDHEGKDLGELTAVEPTPRVLSRPELIAPPSGAAD
jgi:DNA recombination protein RmuC